MALNKSITLKNGIVIRYHRVKHVEVENGGDTIELVTMIQSFVNEDYRDESLANSVSQRVYTFEVERPIVEDNNIFEVIYGLLKTLDEFKDAEDV